MVGSWLADPLVTVGEEGGTVHQNGAGLRDVVAETVQDREAVGVDVAPVDESRAVSQPSDSSTSTAYPPPRMTIAPRGSGKAR